MGRQARLVVAGQPHHVYLRGNNRRILFSSRGDRLFWLACLRRALDATKCQLHQLTLMTNHVHSIVTPPDEEALSTMMKRLCQRYAQERNQKRGASGKVFEERYRSKVIEDEAQMMFTTLYNDANGYHGGLVTDPFTHEWSTVPLHAGVPGARLLRSLWTPSPWYQRLGKTKSARADAYRRLMIAYVETNPEPVDSVLAIDAKAERADAAPYSRRIRRPNGRSARS
jgi:putative transposase